MENVLFLITARSGSKGLPNKNILNLNKLPLLAYKIKTALSIADCSNVWLNTDSERYAEIGNYYNATIPFLRPKNLARDGSSSIDVILHTIDFLKKNNKDYKYICLLEPTSPFVYYTDIENAFQKLISTKNAKAIVATKEVRTNSVFIQNEAEFLNKLASNIKKLLSLNRQSLQRQITPSGGFYITEIEYFIKHKTFYTNKTLSYNLPLGCDLEIDEPIDFKMAEFYLKNNIIDIKKVFK